MSIKIKTVQETTFDVLSLGECMIRLSPPGHQRIELTPFFEAYAGGGEYNVTYALARYGMRTSWIARLVDNLSGNLSRIMPVQAGWISVKSSGFHMTVQVEQIA
jgi:2-dehydro-3-deoxygluconokinase